MNYDGDIIRPPSEANSIIIQVTVGCSHNKCTFCGAYKRVGKTFSIRSTAAILENIKIAAKIFPKRKRVFLADGDALILSTNKLKEIFGLIRKHLPQVRKISLYGNAKSIRSKTLSELSQLKNLGLDRVYMGLESGDDRLLKEICKGETATSMIEAGKKIQTVDLFLSVTVLLGLAGSVAARSLAHAQETARVLSAINPKQIAALCLIPLDNTPLGRQYLQGEFILPSPMGMLQELHVLLEKIECRRVLFMANHASNYLPLSGVLSRDKQRLLAEIEMALSGKRELVPDYYRAL